jgi:pimeloyl-ACP methyl ester carboxylesterase
MPYVTVNDIRMYYKEAGAGEPLLLLHGALGAVDPLVSSSWSTLLPSFAARYRTFSLEHRGHGRTGNPSGALSSAQIAADVAAFIDRFNLAPVHVVGFSQGAEAGLALAMTRPAMLRSLICVGANYRLDDRLREAADFFDADILEREQPEFAAELARRHDAHHHPGYWRELVRQTQAYVETGLAWTEEDLRRISVPTLLVMGEADFAVSLEQMLEMRRAIPRSEMLILNHAGMDGLANHRVHHTRADVVGPVILEFLARQTGTMPNGPGA